MGATMSKGLISTNEKGSVWINGCTYCCAECGYIGFTKLLSYDGSAYQCENCEEVYIGQNETFIPYGVDEVLHNWRAL
jgi:hypothetical protein